MLKQWHSVASVSSDGLMWPFSSLRYASAPLRRHAPVALVTFAPASVAAQLGPNAFVTAFGSFTTGVVFSCDGADSLALMAAEGLPMC
jgi:hypothetical protein